MVSLNHSSHHHQLAKIPGSIQEFTCRQCCSLIGSGTHYRCHDCNFNLHEHCALSEMPQTIKNFFAHPWHDLRLSQDPPMAARFCDLCKEPIGGNFYHCAPCGFDVHQHCMKIQQVVSTQSHRSDHFLYLVPGVPKCNACYQIKGFWLYRCGHCNFNLHIECLHKPIPPVSNSFGQSSTSSAPVPHGGPAYANNMNSMPPSLAHSQSAHQLGTNHNSSISQGMVANILLRLGYDIAADVIGNVLSSN